MDEFQKLELVPTCKLVDELEKREGVQITNVEPYEEVDVHADGPAIVLVVID